MFKRSQAKTRLRWVTKLLAIAVVCGCSPDNQTTQPQVVADVSTEKPKVVASYSVLCDMAAEIAQDSVDLTCLVEPEADPHTYQATPADRKAIETANLILYGGYDFEPTIINLVEATKNVAPKVAVNEQAVTQPLMGEPHDHDHHEGEEHTHAEDEMAPDPHVWHDANNGVRMAEVIRDQLQQVAPDDRELYTRNAQQLINQLQQVDNWIKAQVDTIPPQQRKLVTTHDALGYYANAYSLEVEGSLQGFSTEEQPTAARLKQLVQEVKSANVPTIFAEVTANDKVIGTVAREAQVEIADQALYADGLGAEGSPAGTYIGMLTTNTCTIVDGLGGKCKPETP